MSLLAWGLALSLSAAADDLVNPSIGITEVLINLANQDLPANDLVYTGQPQYPTQQDAYRLKTQNTVDLSLLQPKAPSDIWVGSSTGLDESADQGLMIQSGDETNFAGKVQASTGNFKMAVQLQSDSSKAFTLQISRTLHTLFLRKEILRRLGYKIPPMKYLSLVKVQFADSLTRDNVLIQLIPKATTGASSRWCYVQPDVLQQNKDVPCQALPTTQTLANPNEVLFQDVMAIEATPLIYNVAMAVPINGATLAIDTASRTLRSLAIVDALVNVPESVNQLAWYEGLIDSGRLKFVIPEVANFNCTLDDAKWIMNRIASLTRDDFTNIVAQSYYPAPVAKLLVEKLIARRNSILNLMKMPHTDIAVDTHVGGVDGLANGIITRTSWPNYGSNFAFGPQQSPLQDIQYYFYSLIETNVFTNLVTAFNAKLPALTIATGAAANLAALQQQADRQFLETGTTQAVQFGTWHTPVVNGGVSISRSIVFGSYMGTSQLVQLADTYGYGLNAGLFIGTNGVPANELLSGMISGSVNISYTHLKPVTDLKTAFQVPMKQIYVPNVIHDAASTFGDLLDLKTATANQQDNINKDMTALKEFLDVGDSLIITQSLSGSQSVTGSVGDFTTPIVPQLSVGVGVSEVVLSRLHIYRKDDTTVLVFKDQGEVVSPSISAGFIVGFPISFPILTVSAGAVAGSAHTSISNVNISTDLKNNPGFFTSAQGLQQTLASGDTEVLDSLQKPTLVDVQFLDLDSSLRFFFWSNRTLNTTGHVQVTAADGGQAHYLDMVAGQQSGTTWQAFANDVIGYLLARLTKGGSETLGAPSAPNPGLTFAGSSKTRQTEFQGRTDGGVSAGSVQVLYKYQGWKISTSDALKLVAELQAKYGLEFFDANFLQDTSAIELYQISASLMVYQNGLMQMLKTDPKILNNLESTYNEQLSCDDNSDSFAMGGASNPDPGCAHLRRMLKDLRSSNIALLDPDHLSSLMMDAVNEAEQVLSFPDFVSLMGGVGNYYLSATVSGFREGSETMSQSLPSINSPGHQDPVFPQGVINTLQQSLGIDDGEFKDQWIRSVL